MARALTASVLIHSEGFDPRTALALIVAFQGGKAGRHTAGSIRARLASMIGDTRTEALAAETLAAFNRVETFEQAARSLFEATLDPLDQVRLAERWGGSALDVPRDPRAAFSPIKLAFGCDLAARLSEIFGGFTIPIPALDDIPFALKQALNAIDGWNAAEACDCCEPFFATLRAADRQMSKRAIHRSR